MSGATAIREWTLHSTEGGSDKLYRIQIVDGGVGTFGVRADSCRRGGAWNDQGFKVQGVTLTAAEKKADSTIKGKIAKGYRLLAPSMPGTEILVPVAAVEDDLGIRPQLLNPIDEEEAEKLLADPDWVMQEKKDGTRLMLLRRGSELTGINKKGKPVPVDGKVAKVAMDLEGDFLLDGELVGEVYFVFDLLEVRGRDLRDRDYLNRLQDLLALVGTRQEGAIRLVEIRRGEYDKKNAYLMLMDGNAEGVVFKADAPYAPGRPNSGGDQRKYKFYATASFQVLANNDKRSVALGLVSPDGEIVGVGNVTIPTNKGIPAPWQVVEVRYLYAFPGGSIYQPVYIGPRMDVEPEECVLSQLKFKAGTEEDE